MNFGNLAAREQAASELDSVARRLGELPRTGGEGDEHELGYDHAGDRMKILIELLASSLTRRQSEMDPQQWKDTVQAAFPTAWVCWRWTIAPERATSALPRRGFLSRRRCGATSIDVTRPVIDKAFGIGRLRDTLGIRIEVMIHAGEEWFPSGNDHPAKQTGVISVPVRGPAETRRVIEAVIACPGDDRQPRNFAAQP